MIFRNILLFIFGSFVFSSMGEAQIASDLTPSAVQERSKDTLEYFQDKKGFLRDFDSNEDGSIELLEEDNGALRKEGGSVSFKLMDVVTSPSRILSQDEINHIVFPYRERQVNLNDIYKMIDQINLLYKGKNALVARAILPVQDIKEGVVYIELIEGRVGKFLIQGNESTRASFIRKRISVCEGGLIDFTEFEKSLIRFNVFYDVQAKASLRPGRDLGATDVVLDVQEPKKYEGFIYVDNTGRNETGQERIGLVLSRNSLFGVRDRLSIGGIGADGTEGYNIHYAIPLNRKGTQLEVGYDDSNVSVKSGALRALNIEGDSSVVSFTLRHPLAAKMLVKSSAFIGYNSKSSSTSSNGVNFLERDVRSLFSGIDYLKYDAKGYWYLNSFLTRGFNQFAGDEKFLRFNAEMSRMQRLNESFFAFLRSGFQLSQDAFLSSSEQFQIGGLTTIRGYREGLLIGDAGYFVSAEFHFPVKFENKRRDIFRNRLDGFIFVDHGATIAVENSADDSTLLSSGVGLNVQFNKDLTGRFVAGVPLQDDLVSVESSVRFHFYMQYRF